MTTPSSFRRATVVWFIALLATVHAGAAPLKVHGIFSSHMVLQRDKNDMSMVIEGFSIADASGKFHMAHAAHPIRKDDGIWNTANKSTESNCIHVWSPLVKEPVAVRYAWATSPMGNLKVNGHEWLPLQNFRTDSWDWPEGEDPTVEVVDRAAAKALQSDAEQRLASRRAEEAKQAVRILSEIENLSKPR